MPSPERSRSSRWMSTVSSAISPARTTAPTDADEERASTEALRQPGPELGRHRWVAEGDVDDRRQPTERVARVVAGDRADDAVERRPRCLRLERVGELDLAPGARTDAGDLVEDVGRQHVSPDDDEVARRIVRLRLL